MGIRHTVPVGLPTGVATGKVAGDDWRADHLHVPFEVAMLIANGNTGHAPGASLAANVELFATGKPTRNLIDLSEATEARLVAMVTTLSSTAGSSVKLSYRTKATEASTWAGTDAGPIVVVGSTGGAAGVMHDSGWTSLAAGARVDNIVIAALVGTAFGTTGPTLGSLTVFFR